MANITGWGRGTWGQGAWNAPIPVVVSGIEQVTNGEFDSNTTGWSTTSNSSASVSDGIVTITANQYHTFSQNLTLDAGRSYTISVLTTAKSGNFYVAIHDGSSVTDFTNVTVGTTTLTFTANSGTNQLRLYPYSSGTGHTLSVDSISVKGAVETEGTASVGTATVLPSISVAVTGVAGTTAVGSESVTAGAKVVETGVAGTTSLGSETVSAGATVVESVVGATGNQGSGQIGDEVTRPQGIFGVTGTQGSTALGTVVAAPQSIISVTGVAGTGQAGTITESGTSLVAPTGVEGTGQLGNEVAFSNITIVETGLAGTTALGSVTALPSITIAVTGLAGTTGLGNETVLPSITTAVTGQVGTTSLGTATAVPSIEFAATGFAATGSVGDVLAAGGAKVVEDAVTGSVNLGDEAVSGTSNLSLTGVSSNVGIGNTLTTFTITVVGGNPSNHPYYNVGSSNKYAINGSTATADVLLTLEEGRTYRFDQSDSSNSGHPLRFSKTANGTHGGGSEYTTGVTTNGTPGQSGAYTEITVAHDAPTLYYYCTNHSAMGWQANTEENFATFTITVVGGNPSNHPNYNVGSSNKYAINGSTATTNVVLSLVEGQRYRFDQSDASNSGHPLRFTADAASQTSAASSSLTEYTTGVTTNGTPGQSGAYTEIIIASGAPRLYYHCTNHSAMGATVHTFDSIFNVVGTANTVVTGLASTSAVGTAVVVPVIEVAVTTVVGTMSLGDETVAPTNNFSVTGVEGTGALGTLNLYGLIENNVSVSYTEVTPSQNANYEAA